MTKFINFLLAETALNHIELISKDHACEERFEPRERFLLMVDSA